MRTAPGLHSVGVLLATMLTCGVAASAEPPEGGAARFEFGDVAADRDRIRVRPDGLLEAVLDFSTVRSGIWDPQLARQGRSERRERLIDCRNGFHLDTAISLLDAAGQSLARIETGLEEQLQQMALRRDEMRRRRWPTLDEQWLACRLAVSPERMTDPDAFIDAVDWRFNYDYEAIGDAPPGEARGLFARLRAQYDAWQARYLPARQVQSDRNRSVRTAKPLRGERWMSISTAPDSDGETFDLASLRHRGEGVIEIKGRTGEVERWPDGIRRQEVQVEQVSAIDCRTGLSVPVEQTFLRASDGAVLLRRSAPVLTTLARLANPWNGTEWQEWIGPGTPDRFDPDTAPARLCRLAAERCGAAASSAPFELQPAALGSTPGAPMLLSAGAAWQSHRASFLPTCRMGD